MMELFALTLLLVIVYASIIDARVHFEFGHFVQPVIKRTPDGNGTFLRNADILINHKCMASYPTEWIFDADDEKPNTERTHRNEWTDRKFKNSIKETKYDYIAWIHLQITKLVAAETFKCQAVGNPQDSIYVQFNPRDESVEISTWIKTEALVNPPEQTQCEFQFTIMYIKDFGYYARCVNTESQNEVRSIVNHECPYSAAFCANTFRNVKSLNNACVNTISGNVERIQENGWIRIGGNNEKNILIPGTVVCSMATSRGAVEYFFTAPDIQTGRRNIHFSWDEVQAYEMIWTIPSKFEDTYYVGQSLQFVCIVPKYGFSFDPVLITRINGTTQQEARNFEEDQENKTWKKSVEIKFQMVGFFEISCLGPVWNTTEWAARKIEFSIRESVPPYFEKPYENLTLYEGKDKKEIICKARGDPIPKVEWIVQTGFHGIKVNENALIFLSVFEYLEGEYTCKATNSLGESAIKLISVKVQKKSLYAGGNSTGIAIGVAGGILVIVFLALSLFYIKFKKLNKIITGLTTEEILEFREGKRRTQGQFLTCPEFIESLSYNNSYELVKSRFQVDTDNPLGSGAYGIVYKGTVNTENGVVDAAFKTVKRDADLSYLKALLSELKILIHIGNHDSIVNLIGAWTQNIRNREIFVAVELCDVCLLNFVRENSCSFVNYVKNGIITRDPTLSAITYQNFQDSRKFSTFNLMQWAREIASALEYVTNKHIVHGDVAARNILLTSRLESKLCDFGLARQLIDYNYIKSEQCPLPWKWMAIESLRQMNFSAKSDVWAYGITLWEIFTLGDVPYPGLTWSAEFVQELENGLRMNQPKNMPNDIWNQIIQCWHQKPESRQDFRQLKEFFDNLQTKYASHEVIV